MFRIPHMYIVNYYYSCVFSHNYLLMTSYLYRSWKYQRRCLQQQQSTWWQILILLYSMISAKTLVSIFTFTPNLRPHTTSYSCLETKCRNSQSLACKSTDAGSLQTDLITARNYLIEIFHKSVVCCTICALNTGIFSLSVYQFECSFWSWHQWSPATVLLSGGTRLPPS